MNRLTRTSARRTRELAGTSGLLALLLVMTLGTGTPARAAPGGFLGAYLADEDSRDPNPGAAIAFVVSGSPAAVAGLRGGDRVLAWDGEETLGPSELAERLVRGSPGEEHRMTVLRDGERVQLVVRLGAWGDHHAAQRAAGSTDATDSTREAGNAVLLAGRPVPIGAPVVTYRDPDGYDGYLERCVFTPEQVLPRRPAPGCDEPRRYGARRDLLAPLAEVVEARGWTPELAALQIDQVVLHYDVAWTSQNCFKVLHDLRGLSCHFLLDVDGTLYQTLDLVERARHAGAANSRSIGIEIAHPGPLELTAGLAERYRAIAGEPGVAFDLGHLAGTVRTPGFLVRPARPEPIQGEVQGRVYTQWDFTDAQYETLTRLLAALSRVLPRLRLDAPRAEDGSIPTAVLPAEQVAAFSGLLGHYHVSAHKQDPGPAFDWERVLTGARRLARER